MEPSLAERIADIVLRQYREPWPNDRQEARKKLIRHIELEMEGGETDEELLFDSAAEEFVEGWQNRY